MLSVFKLLKARKIFNAVNLAGIAGRSVNNVSTAYTGIKRILNGSSDGRSAGGGTYYLNPRERYKVVIMVEGIELETKRGCSPFQLIEIVNAMGHVSGMSLRVECAPKKHSRWPLNRTRGRIRDNLETMVAESATVSSDPKEAEVC